jgi:hypothetical protein
VEGLEISILKGLDWERYSPKFLLVESLEMVGSEIMDYNKTEEYRFFKSKGYEIIGKTRRTLIFKKIEKDK